MEVTFTLSPTTTTDWACECGHPHWGAHIRAKNLKVAYCRSAINPRNDYSAQKRWDAGLDRYQAARDEGIQPESTKKQDVEVAKEISDRSGKAFGNGFYGHHLL